MKILNYINRSLYLDQYSKLEKFFIICFSMIFLGYFFFSATMQRNFIYLPAPFLFYYLFKNRGCPVWQRNMPLWFGLGVFLIYNLASTFWSVNFSVSMFFSFLRYEMMAALFTTSLAILCFKHSQTWSILYKVYLFSAILSGIILLIFYSYQTVHDHFILLRIKGFGRAENSNMCAALYSLAILFLFYAPLKEIRLFNNRMMLGIVFSIPLLITILTVGRGPLIALLVTFFGMAILQRQYRQLAFLCLATCLVLSFVFWNPADWGDIVKRGDDNRFQIWHEALQYPAHRPIVGAGIGTQLDFQVPGMTEHFNSTHNLFLGALVYGGVVGLVLLIIIYGFMIFYGLRYNALSSDKSIMAILIYGTVFFMFETHMLILNVNPEWLFFYVPIGVIAGFIASYSRYDENMITANFAEI